MSGTALITGATAGIGLEFARQLAARGYDLILVARDVARLNALAAELAAGSGISAEPLPADLSTSEGIARTVDRIAAQPLDILVHNAGFGTKGFLHKTDAASQEAMVTLHVTATNQLVRAALPGMLGRNNGTVIVVSSVSSFAISAANVNYTATKTYQRIFMESLSLELEGTGVRAQALCPGFTRTEFHDRARMNMSAISPGLWMSAEAVVRASLRAMDRKGPVVVVPGWKWKVIVTLLQHLPRRFLRGSARRYQQTRV